MESFVPIFKLDARGVAVVTDDGRSLTYDELRRSSDEWATPIPPRALVFLLVGNNVDSLVAYVGCLNHGIVPLLLDARIDRSMLAQLREVYTPDFIWCPESNGYCLEKVVHRQATSESALFSDLALLLTTSGSTGSPKLVRQSYANIRANTASIIDYLQLDATERPITTLPMNYTYGLSIINSHLVAGGTILLTEKSILQREFWNFFVEHGATSFGGVPYTYEMLDKLMFFRRKMPSLRTMTQAGGKLSLELHKKFAEYAAREGKNFVVMYGQCEATARMAYLPPERALEKVGSMGIAIPGGRFKLVGDGGKEITASGEVGELVFEGKNVTLGYAETRDDLALGDQRHGQLATGDLAFCDEDGFYYIVGRKKRFLKVFGNRVGLDEVEKMIKDRFPALDCACSGVDDRVEVYVSGKGNPEAIHAFIADKTHLNRTAFEILQVPSIPRNESGKILYSRLSQLPPIIGELSSVRQSF